MSLFSLARRRTSIVAASTVVLSGALLGGAVRLAGAAQAGAPDPAAVVAAQREAMTALAFMDGTWRGDGWMLQATGERQTFTQTERVGPMLDGAIRVVEGRGYDAEGETVFNAFGVLSFDPADERYSMQSWADGRAGSFTVEPRADGFSWSIPAGPATIRYTATVADGTWREVGERVMPGQPPFQFFEMTLERLGDSDWPAAGAVPLD